MGKGSKRRPTLDSARFDSNWDRIFRKKTITVCKFCQNEVAGIGGPTESLDYCEHCERVVEGNTIEENDDDR